MKIRWARILVCTLIAFVLVLSAAALILWLKLRGTPVPPVGNAAISPGVSGPQEIRLWPGKASGSEDWTQQETETHLFGERYVRNVVDPTLTAWLPRSRRSRRWAAPSSRRTPTTSPTPGAASGSASPSRSPGA